jgi:hypothetical protein
VSQTPQPTFSPAPPGRPADGLAIASMICGIVGLLGVCCFVGVLPGIAGLICGLMSKTPSGPRTAGIVCSCITLALFVVRLVLFFMGVALMGLGAAARNGSHP